VVASWGCGTSCQQHAVVDARDGRIVSYGQLVSELDVDHEIENKILITNPRQNVMPPGSDLEEMEIVMTAARTPRQYWELREADGRGYLNLLCTESAAEGVYELD
jgi:hypothetical protein